MYIFAAMNPYGVTKMIARQEKYFHLLRLINTLLLVNREILLEREREREREREALLYNILKIARTHTSRAEFTKNFFSKQPPFILFFSRIDVLPLARRSVHATPSEGAVRVESVKNIPYGDGASPYKVTHRHPIRSCIITLCGNASLPYRVIHNYHIRSCTLTLCGNGAVWLNLLHFSGLLRHFVPRNDGGVYRHFDRNTWSVSGLPYSRHFDRNTWSVSGMYEVGKSVPPNDDYYNYRFLHSAYSADAPYAPVGMTLGRFVIAAPPSLRRPPPSLRGGTTKQGQQHVSSLRACEAIQKKQQRQHHT